MMNRRIRVLVVDDSAIVRRVLTDVLSAEPDIEVVGSAPDPYVARDKILSLKPDVLTLDLEMPRMDGLSFLKRLMRYQPMPVIVISSIAPAGCAVALEALRLGALEVLAKPGGPYSVEDLSEVLAATVRAAASARLRRPTAKYASSVTAPATDAAIADRSLVVIGASTGGVDAIREVLTRMPADSPPILVVQHMPPNFTAALAERLDRICAMKIAEARHGDHIQRGHVLIAPGGKHMVAARGDGRAPIVLLNEDPQENHFRPSIDVLFRSAARHFGRHTAGVLLTGMGADGARGLLEIRKIGGATIAQNEATCVVYGMPAEAVRLGAAEVVLPLREIAGGIVGGLRRLAPNAAA
jgi:two-component system chemotaxis response regulator CheB